MSSNPPASLREQITKPGLVLAPGAYDAITVGAIERAGFTAAYMSGSGISAAQGLPDRGLLTASEMTAAAGNLAAAVSIPVIADADTGYGNELNVARTVIS